MRHTLLWQFLLMLLIVAFMVKFAWRLVAAVAVIVLGWWLCEGLAVQQPASSSAITKQPPRITLMGVSSALSGYMQCMTWDEFAAWRWAYAHKLAPGQTVSVGDNYPAEVVGVTPASAEDVLLMLRVPADSIFKWPA